MKNKKPAKTATGCRPAQLFGAWAVEPNRFQRMYAQAIKVDLVALGREAKRKRKADAPDAPLPSQRPDVGDSVDETIDEDPLYDNQSGIAVVSLSGPLTKYQTSFQSLFGGTSTLRAQRALRVADADDDVNAIMLLIDSPGGTVDGTEALGGVIAALDKPCYAYIADCGASAAYWCAAQADRIYCNATADVGCIGVFTVLEDTSKAYEQDGVKVHVIGSGGMKGAGTDGTPVTDDQLAYFKSLIDDTNELFISAVAAGRKMTTTQARALADGRVHIGAKAQQIGLVDAVVSYDDAMKALFMESLRMTNPAEAFKAEHPDAYKAITDAGYQSGLKAGEVKGHEAGVAAERERVAALASCATFKGREAFVLEQAGKGHDLGKAKADFADILAAENATLQQQAKAAADANAKREALANAAHPQEPGFTGVNVNAAAGAAAQGDPKLAFEAKIAEHVKAGKTKPAAVQAIYANDRPLYDAYMATAK